MKITINGFILPSKESGKYSMCEDSIAVNIETQSIAIADGVGGSLFPEYLSRHLTSDFVSSPSTFFKVENDEYILSKREDYKVGFEGYADGIIDSLNGIKQKMLQTKRELRVNYASSTFVGCTLVEQGQAVICNYWSLGDSYLFYADSQDQLLQLSSMSEENFGGVPHQFKSNGIVSGKLLHGSFEIKEGVMLLMTDALSDWFIKKRNEETNVIERLKSLRSHEDFKSLIDEELSNGSLKDDDMALILLEIEQDDSIHLSLVQNHVDDLKLLIASENPETKTNDTSVTIDDGSQENNADSTDNDKSIDDSVVIDDDASVDQDRSISDKSSMLNINTQETLEKEVESKEEELIGLESELQSVEDNYMRLKDLVQAKRAELEKLKKSLIMPSSTADSMGDTHDYSMIDPASDKNSDETDKINVIAQDDNNASSPTVDNTSNITTNNQ